MNTFYVKIEVPKNVNLAYLNPNDIQAAFNNFFQQNQHILKKIFENLGKTSVKPDSPNNQEQVVPTDVINPAQTYTDAEWDKLPSDYRSELETNYILNNPELMKKITLAKENYRQGKYFIPTDEQLGFETGE